jgi:hypothetical protein
MSEGRDPKDVKLDKYQKLLMAAKKAIEEGKNKIKQLHAELKNERSKDKDEGTKIPDPKKINRVVLEKGAVWALVDFADEDVESRWISFAKQVRLPN